STQPNGLFEWRPGHQTCPIDAGRSGAQETLVPQSEDQQGVRALRCRDPNDTKPLQVTTCCDFAGGWRASGRSTSEEVWEMRALSTVTGIVETRQHSYSTSRPVPLAAAAAILARLVMAAIGAGALAPVALQAQAPAPDLSTRLVSNLAATAESPITVAQP